MTISISKNGLLIIGAIVVSAGAIYLYKKWQEEKEEREREKERIKDLERRLLETTKQKDDKDSMKDENDKKDKKREDIFIGGGGYGGYVFTPIGGEQGDSVRSVEDTKDTYAVKVGSCIPVKTQTGMKCIDPSTKIPSHYTGHLVDKSSQGGSYKGKGGGYKETPDVKDKGLQDKIVSFVGKGVGGGRNKNVGSLL